METGCIRHLRNGAPLARYLALPIPILVGIIAIVDAIIRAPGQCVQKPQAIHAHPLPHLRKIRIVQGVQPRELVALGGDVKWNSQFPRHDAQGERPHLVHCAPVLHDALRADQYQIDALHDVSHGRIQHHRGGYARGSIGPRRLGAPRVRPALEDHHPKSPPLHHRRPQEQRLHHLATTVRQYHAPLAYERTSHDRDTISGLRGKFGEALAPLEDEELALLELRRFERCPRDVF
mmetsp:Transcript_3364/g.8566  ORF Transcript_3364/g.8566 Transcript_3364/m.8566 type:complete len:234 (-) Transcript_3364:541-1242(-)